MKACCHGFSVHHILEVLVGLPDSQVNLALKHAIQVGVACGRVVPHGVFGGNGLLWGAREGGTKCMTLEM